MKLTRLICEVCRLDTAADSFEGTEVQKRWPGQMCVRASDLAEVPVAPQRKDLHDLLRVQTPAAVYMLLTLWRLGRGDFEPADDLLAEYMDAGDSFPKVQTVVKYLTGKRLARYLENALRSLGKAGIEVDELLE